MVNAKEKYKSGKVMAVCGVGGQTAEKGGVPVL
jgi:hypothetical protein